MSPKILRITLLLSFIITTSTPAYPIDEEQFVSDYFWNRFANLSPPDRPRIALVLGGGGARGLTHIGVLKVLEQERIPVDIVVGTSVGALIGALYCSGVPLDKIESMAETIGWGDLVDVSGPAMVKLLIASQMLSTEKMEKYLKDNIGDLRFDQLEIKFACVATDLITGERIIFREGDVAPAARASATVPGIFTPAEYRHRYLVDGGLLDNVPTGIAKLLNADFIIAVVINSDFSKNKISNTFMVFNQAINIQGKVLDEKSLELADIVIRPYVGDVSAIDLGQWRRCIDAGIAETNRSSKELKRMLIERTSDHLLFK